MYCYNCQQLISIESVDPLHLRLQQNKTSKEMKIKKSQPCANCKGLKRTGVARNRIREQTGQLQYKISQQHERGRTRMKERGKGGIRGKIMVIRKKRKVDCKWLCCSNTPAYRFSSKRETARSLEEKQQEVKGRGEIERVQTVQSWHK